MYELPPERIGRLPVRYLGLQAICTSWRTLEATAFILCCAIAIAGDVIGDVVGDVVGDVLMLTVRRAPCERRPPGTQAVSRQLVSTGGCCSNA